MIHPLNPQKKDENFHFNAKSMQLENMDGPKKNFKGGRQTLV